VHGVGEGILTRGPRQREGWLISGAMRVPGPTGSSGREGSRSWVGFALWAGLVRRKVAHEGEIFFFFHGFTITRSEK
jgi:hypothetical protein